MKLTNLEYTQSILSSLGSDEVNSISDTAESLQVASILRTTYFNILTRAGIQEHRQLIQLQPSLDPDIPTLMYVPDGIKSMEWLQYFNNNPNDEADGTGTHGINVDIVTPGISWSTTSSSTNTIGLGSKTFTVASSTLPIFIGQIVTATSGVNTMTGTVTSYASTTLIINVTSIVGSGTFSSWTIQATTAQNTIPGYQYVTILPVQQFLDMTNFNPNNTNVRSFVFTDSQNGFPGTYTFYYKNDKQPQYCTILSNYYVIFDGYDSAVDDTLQASKTRGYGWVTPVWRMEDDFVPDLKEDQVPLLLNEAKSLAFFEIKQQAHGKAEQESKRQWSSLQKNKSVTERPTYFDALPDFGRRQRTSTRLFKDRGWDRY